jgi:hypothetical protein
MRQITRVHLRRFIPQPQRHTDRYILAFQNLRGCCLVHVEWRSVFEEMERKRAVQLAEMEVDFGGVYVHAAVTYGADNTAYKSIKKKLFNNRGRECLNGKGCFVVPQFASLP